jgi:hypothetical protein
VRGRKKTWIPALGLVALTLPFGSGCMETSWAAARRSDTVAAYNQFIRDHPESRFVDDAKERMDYLRVKTFQTVEVYEEFARRHPKSELLPELQATVEPLFFERARRANTPRAYTEFLGLYPDGRLRAKAEGNQAYVQTVLRDPSPEALQRFIAEYPESDFLPEATRTLEIIDLRAKTAIRTLGIKVDIAPNVSQPERVSRGFTSLIGQAYMARGVKVKALRADQIPGPDLDAWVLVDYREAPASGALGASTLFSYCRIRLVHRAFEEPIWDRSFEAAADHLVKGAYGRDKTIFGNAKYAFWEDFFVPVSTWASSQARVSELRYTEPVQSLHVLADRGALLLERGGVDFIDVSSPTELKILERYRREADLADWRGVRMLREDLAITYGNDGAELIRRGDQQATRLARWEGGEVGAIRAAMLYDDSTLLLAGSRGLFAVRMNRAPLTPQRLLDGEIVALEGQGKFLFVVRPDRVEVALPKHLMMHITARRVPLGKSFRAERASRAGDRIFVFGQGAVAEVSLADPTRPAVVSRIDRTQLGDIADITSDPRHRYVLGERGLQVVDRLSATEEEQPVEDYIQVEADAGLALKGRFALTVGQNALEVFDMAPYYNSRAVITKLKPAKKPSSAPETEEESAPAAPGEAAPAELAPAEGVPSEVAPTQAAPADGQPAPDAAPAEGAPAEGQPAETAPAESEPGDSHQP